LRKILQERLIDTFLSNPFSLSGRNNNVDNLSPREEEEEKSFPKLIDPGASFGAFIGKLGDVLIKAIDKPLGQAVNWGRLYSLWPVHLETGCCSVELGAASSPRYDMERFGVLEAFGSLRQCDLIIVLGTVNRKMAPRLRVVYDQMPEPKYVVAMGACAITGGLYFDSYNVLPGVDSILPADVYVPGCPPRPETLIQAIMLLQEKIKRSTLKKV
jgi:NADH-quinone oxidoreductase subunit B